MIGPLSLALRYLSHYRLRSVILVVCLSIAFVLPTAVHWLVGYYEQVMVSRADATPLVLGAPGSRFDLVLNGLYFKGRLRSELTMAQAEGASMGDLADAIPLHVKFTAGGQPIVGTSFDYFEYRGLTAARGRLPRQMGEAVVGATAARLLNVEPGDSLLSDDEQLYDISSTYPLLMKVVGVLGRTGAADDLAVFTDVKTTWVIEGIGHGHIDAEQIKDPTKVKSLSPGSMVMTGAVVQYHEITPENIAGFHFHGDSSSHPITGVILLPHDAKSATRLKARYQDATDVQAIVPRDVVDEMLELIFRVRRFLDAVFALVLAATALFMVLVLWLSSRIRRREFQTLERIGCGHGTVFAMHVIEIVLLLSVAALIAAAVLAVIAWYVTAFDVLI
jgi:putative ABC transport system permease protein